MSAEEIRNRIETLLEDIEFSYHGKDGSICPFSREDISLCYDGQVTDVSSVDAAMSELFIEGKSLNEIAQELEF